MTDGILTKLFEATEMESVEILTRICHKNEQGVHTFIMVKNEHSKKMGKKTMAYRLETFNMHFNQKMEMSLNIIIIGLLL